MAKVMETPYSSLSPLVSKLRDPEAERERKARRLQLSHANMLNFSAGLFVKAGVPIKDLARWMLERLVDDMDAVSEEIVRSAGHTMLSIGQRDWISMLSSLLQFYRIPLKHVKSVAWVQLVRVYPRLAGVLMRQHLLFEEGADDPVEPIERTKAPVWTFPITIFYYAVYLVYPNIHRRDPYELTSMLLQACAPSPPSLTSSQLLILHNAIMQDQSATAQTVHHTISSALRFMGIPYASTFHVQWSRFLSGLGLVCPGIRSLMLNVQRYRRDFVSHVLEGRMMTLYPELWALLRRECVVHGEGACEEKRDVNV